jgi:GNAT superfamily N-acetyltransferase
LWCFVRREDGDHQNADIGCALMTGHPRNTQAELMYMGLVPEARGQGLGRVVVQHVKRVARTAGFRRLVVAVDRNNTPALRVYEGEGFHVWDERDVWIKTNATHSAGNNDAH